MNSNKIRPKDETKDLILSITKNCETLIEQTHRKAEETLEFKLIKPKETLKFLPPIQTKGDWTISLTSLIVHNSIFIINKTNKKFELYTNTFEEFSFTDLKDEVEEFLNISNITPYHLQHETIGPRIIQTYWKVRSEKSSTDGYSNLLVGYARSTFRDFESYLRLVIGLNEDDIQVNLKLI